MKYLATSVCQKRGTIKENKSEVTLSFVGDFNPMMTMMIKKPLTKFVETLTENIGKL